VHDAAGRRVRVLADVAMRAGPHRLLWDGRDEAGARVASGVYFVSVTGGGASGATRVVVSR
jgi:alkaline phosphatase